MLLKGHGGTSLSFLKEFDAEQIQIYKYITDNNLINELITFDEDTKLKYQKTPNVGVCIHFT